MTRTELLVTELARYASNYREEVFGSIEDELNVTRDELLETDTRTAQEFFYRLYGFNRSAAMKAGYQHRAVDALRETGPTEQIDPKALWRQFERGCNRNGIGPNEPRNRKLLMETARFANRKGNLFRWVGRELERDVRLRTLASELESLHGIGSGKARFFLRDAVWICGKETDVASRDRHELQPLTGPVRNVARAIWPDTESQAEMTKRIVKTCDDAGVSGVEFNQGAWYFRDRGPGTLTDLDWRRQ